MKFFQEIIFWFGAICAGLIFCTILIFSGAIVRESIGSFRFALKLRKGELDVHGEHKNRFLKLWWIAFAGPRAVTIYSKERGKAMDLYRDPEDEKEK